MAKTQNNVETTVLRKMSNKALGFDKRSITALLTANDGKAVTLYQVFGIVRKAEGGEGSNGKWIRFVGDFQAQGDGVTVEKDGSVSRSPFVARASKLFVPGIFESELENHVLAATDDKGKVAPVEFAIEVGATVDDATATGYTFTVKPLIKMRDNDQLANLATKLAAGKTQGKTEA